jgi:hypothetical protein
VAGQPDASHAWIRYMAFLLTLGDAQGARKIADRALATINYRRAIAMKAPPGAYTCILQPECLPDDGRLSLHAGHHPPQARPAEEYLLGSQPCTLKSNSAAEMVGSFGC